MGEPLPRLAAAPPVGGLDPYTLPAVEEFYQAIDLSQLAPTPNAV